jgi:cytochrome c-type biogenesis protein CcmF
MAVPIGVALLFLMGVGPALPWGRATGGQAARALLPPLVGATALALVGFLLGVRNRWTLTALLFGGFTAQVTLSEMLLPVRQRMRAHGESVVVALRNAHLRGRRRLGAYLAHAGAVLAIVAIAISSTMSSSKEVELRTGDTVTLGRYTLSLEGVEAVAEPHRESVRARMTVARDGRPQRVLLPSMNYYESQREPIGTPAVRSGLTEDLYLSVHNIDARTGRVGLLVLVTPMVAWIWVAAAVMALGGLVALLPPLRLGMVAERAASAPVGVAGAR